MNSHQELTDPPLTAEVIPVDGTVRHGFFTRLGGVSEGRYASLNCGLGSADDPERVRENRARAMRWLGLAEISLATVRQVHSPTVVHVEAPWPDDARPQADAMVTRTRGLAIGILTADCAPVIFVDRTAGVVGAAHAGWRGARYGVVEATLAAMVDLGGRRDHIAAAVGPCIRQVSYEVGEDFRQAFDGDGTAADSYFKPGRRPGHLQFDLAGYVVGRLAAAGVTNISVLPFDTCADDRFFSYRRTTLAGGGDYGRMLSAIALD